MKFIDPDREISRTLDALNEARTAGMRAEHLMTVAHLLDMLAEQGVENAQDDRDTATVVRLLADVELVIDGDLPGRLFTVSRFEGAAGRVLHRMTATPGITDRAALFGEAVQAIDGMVSDTTLESLACLPYSPGRLGWSDELYLPASFPRLVRTVWRAWSGSRAA